ncbi:MAG: ATP-binding protein, partial [Chloroflexi bacterium]|nr:ATP-binding protein [Chloroflexota bacterium]
ALVVDGTRIEAGSEPAAVVDELIRTVAAPLFVLSTEPWPIEARLLDVLPVKRPSRVEQRSLWRNALARHSNSVNGEIDAIVQQFDLGPAAISEIAAGAARQSVGPISGRDLWDACRERTGSALDGLARRIEPAYDWEDIVVVDDVLEQLREVAEQVEQRARVYEDWGFGARLGRGRGITALFAGPSGTGKTMAAEILARHLRLELHRIDLAGVVSKYIGETEKNLRRVFDAAESSGAILLFDEADALFGTRTEVRDSHDRYANVEINYLLQRMEDYGGLAILATNRRAALDPAFLRRLRFVIEFPFPGQDERRRIWERVFPPAAALDDVDNGSLSRLEVTGGNIRTIAVNAAFLAAADARPIGMSHVMRAAAREYAKLSKPVSNAEFGTWVTVARG